MRRRAGARRATFACDQNAAKIASILRFVRVEKSVRLFEIFCVGFVTESISIRAAILSTR
jgi:hypothetical protein